MFSVQQMRNVLVLSEQKNFARAAKELNISQPTLSRSIQSLEAILGSRLFERNNTGVSLTHSGEIVCKHARQVVASSQTMQEEISDYQGLMTGSLRIAAGSYVANTLLPDAVSEFSQLYPAIDINIEVIEWASLEEKITHSSFDFVMMESSDLPAILPIETYPLKRHQAFFYCRSGHPLFNLDRVCYTDLLSYTLVMPQMPERIVTLFGKLQQEDAGTERCDLQDQPHLCVDDQSLIKGIILQSDKLAIGTLGMLERNMREGTLRILPVLIPQLRLNADILRRKGLSPSPAASRFIEILKRIDNELFSKMEAMLNETDYKKFRRYG